MILTLSLNTAYSSVVYSNAEKAKEVSISLEKVDYKHLGKRLSLQVFSIKEQENLVKIEIGVGTTDRPARVHDCITVAFSGTGFIEKIEKDNDSGSCNF